MKTVSFSIPTKMGDRRLSALKDRKDNRSLCLTLHFLRDLLCEMLGL